MIFLLVESFSFVLAEWWWPTNKDFRPFQGQECSCIKSSGDVRSPLRYSNTQHAEDNQRNVRFEEVIKAWRGRVEKIMRGQ